MLVATSSLICKVHLSPPTSAAGKSDVLSDTVSYTDIYRIVKGVVEGPPKNLLEAVAEHITSTTLEKFPQITAVRVKVGKPHVAVPGPLDYLGIEIVRYRSSLKSDQAA
ncbi:hypothetical protein EUGRSUZ_G00614 [Eucalyptus grandis]|uniref:dihydroneopterin aldolase n=2 Tax=Eucalyptus grandis TaxID=71139 RepID=A0A059BAX3_EUCGR|nr:hypothetical protein EUGRSUZ_G00614 [Eucalyptus grandis]